MNRLEKLWKGLFLTLLMGTVITFSNCDDEESESEPEATETLYELLSADADLSRFKDYVDADANLKSLLEGSTTYTLFAPTNAAFVSLEETLKSSLDNVASNVVASVLNFQLATGEVLGSEITNGNFTTVQGEAIVGNADGTIKTGGSNSAVEVLSTDVLAINGRMHKVGTILIPPTVFGFIGEHLNKISQSILLGKDFTTLAAAISKADEFATSASLASTITAILKSDGLDAQYTMFAPTNATFDAGQVTSDTYTGQQWYGIIMNHITSGSVGIGPDDFTTCASFTTLAGAQLVIFNNTEVVPADNGVGIYFDSNSDVVCDLSDAGVSLANLDAELVLADAVPDLANGRLHVIAGVLAPPAPAQ